MGRAPCCDKNNVKRGPWSPEEDAILKSYVKSYGTGGNWITLPKKAGLRRCGKSCRLRWLNYLMPDIKHGGFTEEEDEIICNLYNEKGSRWSLIASRLPGRTDNDVKNYWNTKLKKKLLGSGKMTMTTNPNLFPSNYDGMTDGTSLPVDLGLMNKPPNLPFHKAYYDRTMNDVNPEMRPVTLLSQDYSLTSTSNSSPGITGMDSASNASVGGSTEEGSFFVDNGMQQIWDFVNKLLFEEEPIIETPPRFYRPSFLSTYPQSFIDHPMNQRFPAEFE